jgi:hypothetical protein
MGAGGGALLTTAGRENTRFASVLGRFVAGKKDANLENAPKFVFADDGLLPFSITQFVGTSHTSSSSFKLKLLQGLKILVVV